MTYFKFNTFVIKYINIIKFVFNYKMYNKNISSKVSINLFNKCNNNTVKAAFSKWILNIFLSVYSCHFSSICGDGTDPVSYTHLHGRFFKICFDEHKLSLIHI